MGCQHWGLGRFVYLPDVMVLPSCLRRSFWFVPNRPILAASRRGRPEEGRRERSYKVLHCTPTCEYSTDDQGKQHLRRVRIKIWDDREYFDPAAVRRHEEYEDIEEAIERLVEFGDEPSFDAKSRISSSMLANLLMRYKRTGILRSAEDPPKVDLKAAFDRLARSNI